MRSFPGRRVTARGNAVPYTSGAVEL